MRIQLAFALTVAATSVMLASEQAHSTLTPKELLAVKRIATRLVGVPMNDSKPILERVRPYMLKPDELDRIPAVCSAQCDVTVPLRGGYFLSYIFANPPHGWRIEPGNPLFSDDGVPLILSVEIHRGYGIRDTHKGIVFSRFLSL